MKGKTLDAIPGKPRSDWEEDSRGRAVEVTVFTFRVRSVDRALVKKMALHALNGHPISLSITFQQAGLEEVGEEAAIRFPLGVADAKS